MCPPSPVIFTGSSQHHPEAPQQSRGPSPRPPHPLASGRQRWAQASSEPLGCLLQLPTASVPGEVSKASDPRTGMRKASSKQSQLPAPAQGGRRGESSRPRGAAWLGTALGTRMHNPDVDAQS